MAVVKQLGLRMCHRAGTAMGAPLTHAAPRGQTRSRQRGSCIVRGGGGRASCESASLRGATPSPLSPQPQNTHNQMAEVTVPGVGTARGTVEGNTRVFKGEAHPPPPAQPHPTPVRARQGSRTRRRLVSRMPGSQCSGPPRASTPPAPRRSWPPTKGALPRPA